MSKDIKRDLKGCPILAGARLYEYDARPKNKKPNSSDLKSQASIRLLVLLKKGRMGDRLACKDIPVRKESVEDRALRFQKEYAEAPKAAQIAFHNNQVKDLRKELKELEENSNKYKLAFMKPIIEQQIVEHEQKMLELYQELKGKK